VIEIFKKFNIGQRILALRLTARRYNLVGGTRRKHRVASWYFRQEAIPVQGGYGVVFANPGTGFIEAGRVAVQFVSKPKNCNGAGF